MENTAAAAANNDDDDDKVVNDDGYDYEAHIHPRFSCIVFDIKMHSRVELDVTFRLSRSPYERARDAHVFVPSARIEFDRLF